MAVIEIGKIQVRRGQENQTGVPQLDGGEFAWAADTERLYIGLRRADGGSRDDNVEILTENHLKNFFQISYTSSTYIYKEGSYITAPLDDPFNETQRTVQEKLDDIEVSVKDFGVIGNNTTTGVLQWDMARLQLAIDRLFLDTQILSTSSVHPRRILKFPAGVYNFTSTLYIPAYTTIVGEGIGKTIFNLTTTTNFADSLIKTIDYSSLGNGLSLGYKHFDAGAGDGSEFSGTGTAKFVTIQDLTMKFDSAGTTITNAMSLLSLDCADNSLVKRVEFVGNYQPYTGSTSTSAYIAINLRGKVSNGTHENTKIEDCIFRNLYSGVKSNHDIKHIKIIGNKFENLTRGINFNQPLQGLVGPKNIYIGNNYFDLIEQQAIFVGSNNYNTGSYIVSEENTFERVGFTGVWGDLGQTGTTAIITFDQNQCSSINDRFRRADIHQQNINSNDVYYPMLVEGFTILENSYVSTSTFNTVSSAQVGTYQRLFRFPFDGTSQHLQIKYEMFNENIATASTTATESISNAFTLTVAWSSQTLFQGYLLPAAGIPAGTRVLQQISNESKIILSKPITVSIGDTITSIYPIDVIGELDVYCQQDAYEPHANVINEYSYLSYNGQIQWQAEVNSTGSYYTISATSLSVVNSPVEIRYQFILKK